MTAAAVDERLASVIAGRCGDPFAVLGPHAEGDQVVVRTFQPGALAVDLVTQAGAAVACARIGEEGLFATSVAPSAARDYRLRVHWPDATQDTADAYSFAPLLGDLDLHLIGEGRHRRLADALGANVATVAGVAGTRFAVWAPNASAVSVIGDFNAWDRRRHPMRMRHGAGVWELFVPEVAPGARYKYALRDARGEALVDKADPLARRAELRPATASIVAAPLAFEWSDGDWMADRARRQDAQAPISIYELHAPSWLRGADGGPLDWKTLGEHLVPYVCALGFTHVELMPIAEYPFDGSWGYQPLGLFAPTARLGDPEGFAQFVDTCHAAGIGVIVDWVPAHFPADAHGLARFDGTALYEHADPREGFHHDWHTLIYNLGRREVAGFLLASALEWLGRYHVDGLRVDAVASMLYRDYSRKSGEWIPNVHGGRENYESVDFLRQLNRLVREDAPGAITIAEESTAWPGVTAAVEQGGLGFDFKWNMGWMHDSLHYVGRDPVHRGWHHDELTFGLVYAFSERFVLPLSHDEVVHGKYSLLGRMPGDAWRRFANLRAYFGFMWMHPGKKLLFMGGEFAQADEWNFAAALPWGVLDDPAHRGVQNLVGDLNRLYRSHPALHADDAHAHGFEWIIGDDRANSVFAWLRRGGGESVVVVANFTPAPKYGYRIGVPTGGRWREVVNTDALSYGGSGVGNGGGTDAEPVASHAQAQSLSLTLPPLALLVLAPAPPGDVQ